LSSPSLCAFFGAARGRRRADLHVRIVGLFSIVAAAPALLMAWVGSVTLERSLNPAFMQDGRGFVQNTSKRQIYFALVNAHR